MPGRERAVVTGDTGTSDTGSCHCGKAHVRIAAEPAETVACNGSIRRRKIAVMSRVHESAFGPRLDADALARYVAAGESRSRVD